MPAYVSGLDPSGTPYTVALGLTGPQADLHGGEEWGDVRGSIGVIAGLRADDGEPVKLTPTGPSVPLRPSDPHAVLGWLAMRTQILAVDGDLGDDPRAVSFDQIPNPAVDY